MIGGCTNLVQVHGRYAWDDPSALARAVYSAMDLHFGQVAADEVKRMTREAVKTLGHEDWVKAQRGWIGGTLVQVAGGSNWRLDIIGPMTRNQHKRLPNPSVYLRQPTFEERGIAMIRAMKRWV